MLNPEFARQIPGSGNGEKAIGNRQQGTVRVWLPPFYLRLRKRDEGKGIVAAAFSVGLGENAEAAS